MNSDEACETVANTMRPAISLPPVDGSNFVWLRHERAGLTRSQDSDWDCVVFDTAAAGRVMEAEAGPPDVRIERQYVVQRYYPWGQVDFLPVFEWNGIEYLDQKRFWSRVQRCDDGLLRPCLAHDAFICWMTQVLWGARYREKYDGFLAAAWCGDRDEFRHCLQSAFGKSWAEYLGGMLDRGEPGRAAAEAGSLRWALGWRGLRRSPGETLWRQVRHWWTELMLHRKAPYPWVAILGPDGSGKSTVVEGLTNGLADRRLKVKMLHWRPQLLWKAASVPGGIVTDPHAKEPRGVLVSAVKLFMLGAEWWLAHLGKLLHFRAKDRMVVSDRYYGDLLIDQRRYRYGAPLCWARLAFKLYPKPERVIFLLADAATIHARKKEVTLEELERQLRVYGEYADSLGDQAMVIDASRPLCEVIEAATEAVLGACRERTVITAGGQRAEVGERLSVVPVSQPNLQGPRSEVRGPRSGLRVLVSAYACHPQRGAEANVAWNLVRELCPRHEIRVLTRESNRDAIESSGEDWVQRVAWEYLDPPSGLHFWRRGRHGFHLFYLWWQLLARGRAKRLMREMEFDVVHHMTFGTYIVPSPLSDLGVPLVFGPVGGGEQTPPGLKGGYGWGGRWEEWQRDSAHWLVERLGFLRHWYQATAWSLAATPVTERALRRLGVTQISMMPQSAIGGDRVARFARESPTRDEVGLRSLRLVSASRLVHWKAVHLALEAVAVARAEGLNVTLKVLQEGPEERALRRRCEELGIEDAVEFAGRLPELDDVFLEMTRADALLHPALHEAFGQACLEALSLGVPVICLDWGGPGMIVDETCGYKVAPANHEETVVGLAAAIGALAEAKRAGQDFSVAAVARATTFHWADMARKIEGVYDKVLKEAEPNPPC